MKVCILACALSLLSSLQASCKSTGLKLYSVELQDSVIDIKEFHMHIYYTKQVVNLILINFNSMFEIIQFMNVLTETIWL